MQSIGNPLLWTLMSVFVLGMLALDLGVFNRKSHVMRWSEALWWTITWITLALIFDGAIYYWRGRVPALEFLTGYVIEYALSVDNLFVFVVLFRLFAVPKLYQHRVLFWGIFGAVIMRAIFIGAGVVLVHKFSWLMYVFGALLVITGIRLLFQDDEEVHPERNPVFRLIRRVVPAVSEYHGEKFTVVQNGRRFATPLLVVLLAIEATDVVFAVDSIPAIFGITTDPFIVFTSNIFAILGLRSLYFLLAHVLDKFHLLKIALSIVLLFVGVKMLIADWYKVPIGISLGVIAALLAAGVALSMLFPEKDKPAADEDESDPAGGAAPPLE